MKRLKQVNETKSLQKIWGLIFDNLRHRIITVIVSSIIGAVIGIYGTIITVQPQLITVSAKVEAIENQYVTRQDFEHFQDVEKARWEALFDSLQIKQKP